MKLKVGRFLGFLLFCFGAGVDASAHEFRLTDTRLTLSEGDFRVEMTCDLDALALGADPSVDNAVLARRLREMPREEFEVRVERLVAWFKRRVRVYFDKVPEDFQVEFPDHGEGPGRRVEFDSVLGTRARFTGTIPGGAGTVSFFASRAFPPVRLAVLDWSGQELSSYLLQRGERSPQIGLDEISRDPGRLEVAGRYLRLGFWHIVPEGLDHILFVLGLFLLGSGLRPLLWQVTAFTVAHTITLGLSTYGIFTLPSRPVEAFIALSIVYVAVENIFTRNLKPWRIAVVFYFGLIHGLGFAGALGDLGLPRGEFVTGLLAFNIGVEMGQLAVVGAAFAVVGWFRGREDYRTHVIIPGSCLIAIVGAYWAVERTFFS